MARTGSSRARLTLDTWWRRLVPPAPSVFREWSGATLEAIWLAVMPRRIGAVFALGVAAALAPDIGPNRWLVIAVLFGLAQPYQVWLWRRALRGWDIPAAIPYIDFQLIALFILIEPRIIIPVSTVMVAGAAFAALVRGRTPAMRAGMLGVVTLGVSLAIRNPDDMVLAVIGVAVAAWVAVDAVSSVAERERRVLGRLQGLVEGVDGVMWERTADGFAYVSSGAEALVGYPPADWEEPGFWESRLHPDDRAWVTEWWHAALAGQGDTQVEYRMVHRDGHSVYVRDLMSITAQPGSGPAGARGLLIDITKNREDERRVQLYADIVENVETGLIVTHLDDPTDDRSLLLMAANPAAGRILNRELGPWLGRRVVEVLPLVAELSFESRLAEVARGGPGFTLERVVMRPGSENEMTVTLRAFSLPDRAVGISLEDVTREAAASDRLRRQAMHDGLTGLPNRSLLRERLNQALSLAHRRRTPVALLVMDLDQFKEVNDALGHHVGDLLLRELAHRIQGMLRDADVFARMGGDEFAVLLTSDVTPEAAVAVAERIRTALHDPFTVDGLRLQTNASVGIALFPEHASDADELSRRADVAMYQAKRAGTGHALYRAELDRSSVRRVSLLSELRNGLANDEFVLHYQPIVEVATGRPVRMEALVRWDHPEHGLLPPSEFIELAAVSGFMGALTEWVMSTAMTEAAGWDAAGLPVGVAVNLSVRNLYDPGLPGQLRSLLDGTTLPADRLTLEVTETELMDDPALALEVLGGIAALGIPTAVDDFGTGYSSLTYLKDLPIRELKIDRSFVSGMLSRVDDLVIVRSMVDLGHNLSLRVVAEGVEDRETLDHLQALGCDLAQGFLVAKPLPAAEAVSWLEQHLGT